MSSTWRVEETSALAGPELQGLRVGVSERLRRTGGDPRAQSSRLRRSATWPTTMRTTAKRKSQNADAAYRLKAWWWYRQRVRVPRGLVPKSEWPRASHGVAVLRQLIHDVHLSRSAACSKFRASSEMLLLPGVFAATFPPGHIWSPSLASLTLAGIPRASPSVQTG